MIYQETFTTFLPCNEELKKAESVDVDLSDLIKREDSNGALVFSDPHAKKIYFKKDDKKIFPLDVPIQADIELTHDCNLRCKHCFINKRSQRFSKKTFDAIKNIADSGVMNFELIGGEPLLVKDVFKIIKYLKNRNKKVSVSTNGTLITKDIARKLALSSISKIFVSLDGSKEINDSIRGNGSFDKALQGIKNLNEAGIIPSISFCINKINVNNIKQLLKELEDTKIKSIFFIFGEHTLGDNEFNKNFFKHSERDKIANKIIAMNLPVKYSMHFYPQKINALYYGCFFKWTMCQATPSGDILSCPIIREKEGNVLEEDMKTIWRRMQDKLTKSRETKCKKCKWNERCIPCKFDNH